MYVSCLVIIQSPQNQSVCEGETATFTCVVMFTSMMPRGASFFIDDGNADANLEQDHVVTNNASQFTTAPANVTSVLTVTNVNISNNRSNYFCQQGSRGNPSETVYLTVISK